MENSLTSATEEARQSLLTFRLATVIVVLAGLLLVMLAQRYL